MKRLTDPDSFITSVIIESQPHESQDAFENRFIMHKRELEKHPPLTKREYFSTAAMQGMLSNNDAVNRIWKAATRIYPDDLAKAGQECERCVARNSVAMADALIEELNRNKTEESLKVATE